MVLSYILYISLLHLVTMFRGSKEMYREAEEISCKRVFLDVPYRHLDNSQLVG